MSHFHVRVATDDLTFSACHFIALADGSCERLHGHNYRVAAEVHGRLDEDHFVIDFVALHNALRRIVKQLDHRVLLPTEHSRIGVGGDSQEVQVEFGQRRWVFPRGDCLLLPIPNTTTELLAQYVAQRLLESVSSQMGCRPELVRAEIQESPGVSAVCELGDQ